MNRRIALQLLAGATATLPTLTALAQTLHAQLGEGQRLCILTSQQNALISRIADLILPQTDTPGALALRINEFVDLLLAESLLENDTQLFLAGLAKIDERCQSLHRSDFLHLPQDQQIRLLTALDVSAMSAAAGQTEPVTEATAESAYATLKQLTLYGYFTSEAVMKSILHTPIIPGRFDGCIPVLPI